MGSSTLIEVFGHIVFSFTRGVTEHYNPEEPEFTAESFGYNPLESTGREWYYHPVEEVIYQEYSDRELTSLDYLASSSLHVRVVDASSPGENEEGQEAQQDEDRAMAWKRLRPSALRTVCKSIYIGALISPLTATFIGTLYMLVSYLCYKTTLNCQFHQKNSTSVEVQWFRTISDVIFSTFIHIWYFVNLLFLFRPFQLMGVKRKLILVCFLFYFVESVYRVAVQAFGISRSKASPLEEIALYVFFSLSVSLQLYLVVDHFWRSPTREKFILFLQMTVPGCSPVMLGTLIYYLVYPTYNKQTSQGKLLIALFVPLIGVVIKAICRVCVQRLWNISHPGYSHVLLAPLYFGSAVLCRVLQADLESLQSIAILGIIHGASEVIERSTVVVIDHICHLIWKRKSAPWGSFRTPRRERLMADIAIMSMMFESTAIVSVNGFLYLFQFVYLRNISFINLLQSFAIHTSVQLVIEWCFTSVSLAIETRYQNMAVMAVWRRRWKRHIFVAIVNAVPLAIWTSSTQVVIVRGRFEATISQECKIPFT